MGKFVSHKMVCLVLKNGVPQGVLEIVRKATFVHNPSNIYIVLLLYLYLQSVYFANDEVIVLC